jgi:hypothetical protein
MLLIGERFQMRLPFGLEFRVENIAFQYARGMKVEAAASKASRASTTSEVGLVPDKSTRE